MKARVWLDLARAGNLPSVAGNVLAALVLSAPGFAFPAAIPLALAVFAGWLIYAGGATFNDVADAGFDARHRPERAIPRGSLALRGRLGGDGADGDGARAADFRRCIPLVGGVAGGGHFGVRLDAQTLDRIRRADGRMSGPVGDHGSVSSGTRPHARAPRVARDSFVYIAALSLPARREYLPGAPAAKIGRSVGRLLAFIPFVDAGMLLSFGAWAPAFLCALMVPLGRWAQRVVAAN